MHSSTFNKSEKNDVTVKSENNKLNDKKINNYFYNNEKLLSLSNDNESTIFDTNKTTSVTTKEKRIIFEDIKNKIRIGRFCAECCALRGRASEPSAGPRNTSARRRGLRAR